MKKIIVLSLLVLAVALALALAFPDSRAALATFGLLWGLGLSITIAVLIRRFHRDV